MRVLSITTILLCINLMCFGQELKKISEELIFNSPSFQQCHASTIVEASPGVFLSAAFGGTREGNPDVCIWMSRFENGTWSQPVLMADGIQNDTLRYACWNPVLFKNNKDKIFLFYKVGPGVLPWWGMVRTSDDLGKTWTAPKKLPDGILGPIKNKPVQMEDGKILAPSSTETKESWKAHIEKSVDNGETWVNIPIDHNTEFDVIQPSVLIHGDGMLQVLCRSKNNSVIQSFSNDNGNTWGTMTKTSLPNPNSGTDALTLKSGLHVLVYNPTVQGRNGRAKLNVAISKDGLNWTDAVILENEEKGEYSYPAIIQDSKGKIHITYTYNRVNVKHVILEAL
jgi:alpha-L-fucosidase